MNVPTVHMSHLSLFKNHVTMAAKKPTMRIFEDDEEETPTTRVADSIPFGPKAISGLPDVSPEAATLPTTPRLDIYTDGSAYSNGYEGAVAGIGVWFGSETDPRNLACPLTIGEPTNQNAELQAMFVAAEYGGRALAAGLAQEVNIYTDSQYAINCVTVWIESWRRNHWMTSNRTPVKHRIWIEAIRDIIDTHQPHLSLHKVKGHSGHIGNDWADLFANLGSKRALEMGRKGELVSVPSPPPSPTSLFPLARMLPNKNTDRQSPRVMISAGLKSFKILRPEVHVDEEDLV